jgi:hypothetical protein
MFNVGASDSFRNLDMRMINIIAGTLFTRGGEIAGAAVGGGPRTFS